MHMGILLLCLGQMGGETPFPERDSTKNNARETKERSSAAAYSDQGKLNPWVQCGTPNTADGRVSGQERLCRDHILHYSKYLDTDQTQATRSPNSCRYNRRHMSKGRDKQAREVE